MFRSPGVQFRSIRVFLPLCATDSEYRSNVSASADSGVTRSRAFRGSLWLASNPPLERPPRHTSHIWTGRKNLGSLLYCVYSEFVARAVSFLLAYVGGAPGISCERYRRSIASGRPVWLAQLLLGWLIFGALGVVTLGLGFLLVFVTRTIVNAIVLKITDALSSSLSIDGFGYALLGAIAMSAIGTLSQALLLLT